MPVVDIANQLSETATARTTVGVGNPTTRLTRCPTMYVYTFLDHNIFHTISNK